MLDSRKVCPDWELSSDGNQCLHYELKMGLSSELGGGVKADAGIVLCVLLTLRSVRE